jgi:hypothetical protein
VENLIRVSLAKSCLAALASKFDDDTIKIDTAVFNPARIVKSYGSLAAKGDSTEDRPHRIAKLLTKPENLEAVTVVPVELLKGLAGQAPNKEIRKQQKKDVEGKTKITQEKMEEFLDYYKVGHGSRMAYEDGHKWQIDECPFDSEHRKPDSAVYLFDEGPRFKCSHNSCDGNHWKEFRAKLEDLNPELPKFYFFEKEPFDRSKGPDVEGGGAVPAAAAEEGRPKSTWNELADQLDVIRIGEQEYEDARGRTKNKKLPKHIVEERVYQFVLRAFQERSKFFFDAYPYVYLPDEETIVKFHNDDEAHTLFSRLRLRVEQRDTKLCRSNLELHILTKGEETRVEKYGCWRGDHIYVNNGRGGMFKISAKQISEVPNGTDGVLMLAPEVKPWPELNDENQAKMKAIGRKLGGVGLKVTEDSKLCRHLNALFETQGLDPVQYQQLFLSRYLSLFLSGPNLKLRPILMALGEQNSGKSTLFEKLMWLLLGPGLRVGGAPRRPAVVRRGGHQPPGEDLRQHRRLGRGGAGVHRHHVQVRHRRHDSDRAALRHQCGADVRAALRPDVHGQAQPVPVAPIGPQPAHAVLPDPQAHDRGVQDGRGHAAGIDGGRGRDEARDADAADENLARPGGQQGQRVSAGFRDALLRDVHHEVRRPRGLGRRDAGDLEGLPRRLPAEDRRVRAGRGRAEEVDRVQEPGQPVSRARVPERGTVGQGRRTVAGPEADCRARHYLEERVHARPRARAPLLRPADSGR